MTAGACNANVKVTSKAKETMSVFILTLFLIQNREKKDSNVNRGRILALPHVMARINSKSVFGSVPNR